MGITRRRLICSAGGAVASTAIGGLLLAPRGARAALPPETFAAKSAAEATASVLGISESIIDGTVDLEVPGVVEVADYVPVTVKTALDGVESITIVGEENPNPIIAHYRLDPRLVPYIATRVRLAKAGNVDGLVKAGGTVHRATKSVGVTLGGCGDAEPGPESRAEAPIPSKSILLRTAKGADGLVVRALIAHPMTPPSNRGAPAMSGSPGHYIQEVTAQINGQTVLRGDWSAGVSQNPYLSFKVREAKTGDVISVAWVDNAGMSGSAETKVG